MKKPKETIGVTYTCGTCSVVDRTVQVPCRDNPKQDVRDYFDKVLIPALMKDHFNKSPFCKASKFENLKVPVNKTGDTWIGAPIKESIQ